MRVIHKTAVKKAMQEYPQWESGIFLWFKVFNSSALQFESFAQIREAWKKASGWDTDRVPGATVREEFGKDGTSKADLYVFDIHGTDCRIVCRFISPDKLYIRLIGSHAEYDKWCKSRVGFKRKGQ